eukprot:971867-Alexandrium_andersonii.AAC.1
MALLLSHAVTESQRRALRQSGEFQALFCGMGLSQTGELPTRRGAASSQTDSGTSGVVPASAA